MYLEWLSKNGSLFKERAEQVFLEQSEFNYDIGKFSGERTNFKLESVKCC